MCVCITGTMTYIVLSYHNTSVHMLSQLFQRAGLDTLIHTHQMAEQLYRKCIDYCDCLMCMCEEYVKWFKGHHNQFHVVSELIL